MVKIRVKKSEKDQFLFETTCDTKFEVIIPECAEALIQECKDLALYGIYKSPPKIGEAEKEKIEEEETEGEDEIIDTVSGKKKNSDPAGKRIGIPPSEDQKKTLEKEIKNCEDLLDPSNAQRRKILKMEQLREAIDLLKAAVAICYPMGLPEYDSISIILNPEFKTKDFMDPQKCTMWFAGTQLHRDNPISSIKSVGKRERTTINCKLQKFGFGAPSREPVVDGELQKKLLSYYYKKQEESKKLMENEDDSFLDSRWADPGGLKKNFQNLDNIGWK